MIEPSRLRPHGGGRPTTLMLLFPNPRPRINFPEFDFVGEYRRLGGNPSFGSGKHLVGDPLEGFPQEVRELRDRAIQLTHPPPTILASLRASQWDRVLLAISDDIIMSSDIARSGMIEDYAEAELGGRHAFLRETFFHVFNYM